MIEVEDVTRTEVDKRIGRIKRVFKWAVSEELVPRSAYEALRAVDGLRYGRTNARETEPIKPVLQAWVETVLPFVSPQVAAMIQIQQLAGMRHYEVVKMRACDIDMSSDVWIDEPHDYKNRWRGHDRRIALGPKAQAVIKAFLTLSTTAHLFSPVDAEQWRSEQRRKSRKTPMTPSQSKRRPKKNPKRAKGEWYDVDSCRRAITYGIKKANRERQKQAEIDGAEYVPVPHWCPLQLRHSRATEIRKKYGIAAAQVTLGHARADVTQVYAERNLQAAVRIARETG